MSQNIRAEVKSQVETRRAFHQVEGRLDSLEDKSDALHARLEGFNPGESYTNSISSLTVSNPPTQEEVQQIVSAFNALVSALLASGVIE